MRLFLCALMSVILLASCATSGGVPLIENLSEYRFEQVEKYLRLGAEFSVGQLIDRGVITQEEEWIVEAVEVTLRDLAVKPISATAGRIISEALEKLPAIQQYAKKEYILSAVGLAENFILERGGFGFIKLDDGTLLLTERTKRLLLAIADGIAEGVAENSFVGVAFDSVTPPESYISPDGNAKLAYHRASLAVSVK